MSKKLETEYNQLIAAIGTVVDNAKQVAAKAINSELVNANWHVGKYIVDFEQRGAAKAEYGTRLLQTLAKDLTLNFGKGFSKSNLYLCRQFYISYPIFQTVSGKLSWSHYAERLTITDDQERSFYETISIRDNLSFRELKRQIDSAIYQRAVLEAPIVKKKTTRSVTPQALSVNDVVKDPYVFEFLGLPLQARITERGLEKRLVDNLQSFLLELGKGFAFVARQYKITLDNQHYFIDLLFYHRILKCFVLIDLKTRKVKHQDIGQMNMYLNYFKEEENTNGDADPIGIIIAADKHELLVKYATGGLSNKIFVSKYKLYLPDKNTLEKRLKNII